MELLATPTSAYLLQASLEVLHYENREWQEEITFIQDEVRFLHRLYAKFADKYLPNKQDQAAAQLQEKLFAFTAEVHNLRRMVDEHEHYLADIMQQKKYVSDAEYRRTHQRVKLLVEALFNELKQLKKALFQWTEAVLS
ncbi:MAG: hypothetical protein WA960_21955 [Tunicatimonas sp.]